MMNAVRLLLAVVKTKKVAKDKGQRMKVDLKPENERDIEARLKSGKYTNAGDVIAAGLQALSEKEIEAAAVAKAEASFAQYQAAASARSWSEVKPDMEALLKKRLVEATQRGRT